ncbi:MAG: LysR family transcriptional regulator [Burkholderiales bacterium]|nr:LysR family transcriptional regulator [Burkholderiales bacterium]
MHISLEALQILDAIARKGSFAAAATELERVPSALTYSVRKLEEDLDVLLFDRRGYRAKLTRAGEELLEQGRQLLAAANELERRVKRTGKGWEVELRLALDNLISFERVLPIIEDFEKQMTGTRLRFSFEILTGVWEALLEGRADIVLGAAEGGPDLVRMSGVFQSRHVASVDWVFAVAPQHPLAQVEGPLPPDLIAQHRAIAVGDTGRNLPAVSFGLLSGQDTLTVPSLRDKLMAQVAGLGCGHLPRGYCAPWLLDGSLIEKETLQTKPPANLHLAWRKAAQGKCTKWFIQRLSEPATMAHLLNIQP